MRVRPLVPDTSVLRCDDVDFSSNRISIHVTSSSRSGKCPTCGCPSSRVHSRYLRTLGDLPWHGDQVEIRWRSRRFFCDSVDCVQRIFTERLPQVAAPHARRTNRLQSTLEMIGIACGGEPGSRLATRLGMSASGDTLLRSIRRMTPSESVRPRILGVDDWAFRRGQRYGTLLCDLETHRPVDLLPDRSSDCLRRWLQRQPQVEVISRDRADFYVTGATEGAPQATQVADRWHLLRNLSDALQRVVQRHESSASAIWRSFNSHEQPMEQNADYPNPVTKTSARGRRYELWREMRRLHEQGVSGRQIAVRLGIHRSTVQRYLRSESFPERSPRHYPTPVDEHLDYLRRRWDQGCHNVVQLTRELQQRGFRGSYHMVWRRVSRWHSRPGSISKPRSRRPSARNVTWWLLKPPSRRDTHLGVIAEASHLLAPIQTEKREAPCEGDREINEEVRTPRLHHYLDRGFPSQVQRVVTTRKT